MRDGSPEPPAPACYRSERAAVSVLEPLVEVILCDRHAGLLNHVRYMTPAVVEACSDCEVIA